VIHYSPVETVEPTVPTSISQRRMVSISRLTAPRVLQGITALMAAREADMPKP
jgi:hypothetical protein